MVIVVVFSLFELLIWLLIHYHLKWVDLIWVLLIFTYRCDRKNNLYIQIRFLTLKKKLNQFKLTEKTDKQIRPLINEPIKLIGIDYQRSEIVVSTSSAIFVDWFWMRDRKWFSRVSYSFRAHFLPLSEREGEGGGGITLNSLRQTWYAIPGARFAGNWSPCSIQLTSGYEISYITGSGITK